MKALKKHLSKIAKNRQTALKKKLGSTGYSKLMSKIRKGKKK